jgi:hypothetical protein
MTQPGHASSPDASHDFSRQRGIACLVDATAKPASLTRSGLRGRHPALQYSHASGFVDGSFPRRKRVRRQFDVVERQLARCHQCDQMFAIYQP